MPNLLDFVPDHWGAKIGNELGSATISTVEPDEISFKPATHLALVLLTPQPGREIALNSDRRQTFQAPTGTIEILPLDNEVFARWSVKKENLLAAMDPAQMSQIAGMEWQNDTFELQPPKPGTVDGKLLLMSGFFREEIKRSDTYNALYFESLMILLSTHILRNYSSLGRRTDRLNRGRLSIKAWRLVTDYIQLHLHLSEEITITKMAAISGLSSSHFLRAFRQFSGYSPHQYILEQRLIYSEHLLKSTKLAAKEIARLAGFSSASHMTAAMKRKRSYGPTYLRSSGS